MASSSSVIRTLHIGVGHMGAEIVRVATERTNLEIVGAVDVDPHKVGSDLGQVVDLGCSLGIRVSESIEEALAGAEADIAVLTTGSRIPQVHDQLLQLVTRGLHVISTCEELAFPWLRHPEQAQELERAALVHGVTVLGTGVNPGFIMDRLPATLTGVCQRVCSISIVRVLDSAKRRPPLQRKTGAGLSVSEFEARVKAKTIRHVGLPESLALVAKALGWALDDVEENIEPVVAQRPIASESIRVAPGQVAGLHQTARGAVAGREVISLDLWMALDMENPRDEVHIEGIPPMHVVIPGGTHGDRATVAMVVNSISSVVAARPGVLTVLDLPGPVGVGV